MDRGVVVVGINTQDDPAAVQAFVDNYGITFPVGWDQSDSYDVFRGGDEAISPFPVDVIIAPDGTIAFLAREYDVESLQSALDALVGP